MKKTDLPIDLNSICSLLKTKSNLYDFISFAQKSLNNDYLIQGTPQNQSMFVEIFNKLVHDVNLTNADNSKVKQKIETILSDLKSVKSLTVLVSFDFSENFPTDLYEYFSGLGYQRFIIDIVKEPYEDYLGCKFVIDGEYHDCTISRFVKDFYGQIS